MAFTAGVANVLVVPSFKGFQRAVGSQVNKTMPAAGKTAGAAMGGGMATGLRGASSTVSAAAGTAAGGATGAARAAGATAGTGFVSRMAGTVRGSASAVTGAVRTSLAGGAAAGATAGTATGAGFVGGMTRALGPLAAIFGTGAILGGGFSRLAGMEDAEAKLSGLGHSAQSVEQIIDNAVKSIEGTSFRNEEAAGVAAGLVASGIEPGEELQGILSGIADASTIAGTGMSEMGAIYNKIAAGGRIQGEELAQLGDRGIPILQLLSEELDASVEEVRKMASDGEIGFDQFAAAMESGMAGAAQKSGETTRGTLRNVGAAVSRFGASIMEEIFPKIKEWGALTIETIDNTIIPAFERTVQWVKDNANWLTPMAAGVGALVAAFALYKATVKVVTTLTAAWAAVQAVLNGTLVLNPIGLVVVAIAGLVAALVLAYNKSETFRNVVQAAWDGIRTAVGAVVDWFTGTALPFLQSVWDGIAAGATWLWENVLSPVWGAIKTGWDAVVTAVMWAWENVLKPVWDAVSGAALWLWETVLKPVFSAIWGAWSAMAGFIFDVWTNVLKFTWDLIVYAITNLWSGVLKPIFTAIADRWQTTLLAMKAVWEKYLEPVWNAIKVVATWLYNEHLAPLFDAMGDKWDEILLAMKVVWENVLKPVFEAVGDFIQDKVVPGFERGVDMLKSAWETLKAAFAAPINWVIEYVWNGGIKSAFDSVADAIGSDARLPSISKIGAPDRNRGGGSGRAVQARAKGGYTPPGWTLVGEEGPELIDLRTPGRVYTAGQTQRMFSEDNPPHGGMWDTVGGWVSSAWSGVKSAAGAAVDWVRGGLAKAAGLVLNPIKELIGSTLGDKGRFGGLLSDLGGNAIDSVLEWIKGNDSLTEDPKGRSMNGAQPHVNAAAWALADKVGGIRRMDAFNQSMAGGHPKGLAVDFIDTIGKLNSLADVIADNNGFGKFNYMAWQGRTWAPGRGWAPQKRGYGNDPFHRWHLHGEWHEFDNGGLLKPGMVAYHSQQMRTPDRVLTDRQWSDMHRLATEGRSDDGMRIRGTLDLGNGLTGFVDGRIEAGAKRDARWSR